jgi:hypothetical protein
VLVLWAIPNVAWYVHDTAISLGDVAAVVIRPVPVTSWREPLLRYESGALGVTFFALPVFVAGQKALYVDLLRWLSWRGRFRTTWRPFGDKLDAHGGTTPKRVKYLRSSRDGADRGIFPSLPRQWRSQA